MLVHVPQGCVALVYVGSELRGVLEAGVSCLVQVEGMSLHYVALPVATEAPQDDFAPESVH